jgi:hypothetical protein
MLCYIQDLIGRQNYPIMQCVQCNADPVQRCEIKLNLYNTIWTEIQDGHTCRHVFRCNYVDIGTRILYGVLRIITCENREIALTSKPFPNIPQFSFSSWP